MNIQLHNVISDIIGVTGTAIIEAILAGERDPVQLAKLRNCRIKSSEDIIAKSLKGDYREEHLFVLKQEFDSHNFYHRQIADLDKVIESYYETLDKKGDQTPLGKKKGSRFSNAPRFNLRESLYAFTGVDLQLFPA